ncbi:MAG: hypothetical protein KJ749_02350 [Planctomycetes bacterium]|nr:hypothetical protein [Planctomycetota bacterium]
MGDRPDGQWTGGAPGELRRYGDYGHVRFLPISRYRQLLFFRHVEVKQSTVAMMAR